MSHESPVSMRELELESAELLPTRETLCVTKFHPAHCYGSSHSYSSTSYSYSSSSSYGSTAQGGLVNVSVASGTAAQGGLINVSVASGGLGNLLGITVGNGW